MCFFGTGEVDIWVITRWIMGHNDVTIWDRRSWYWDITRWIMGQNKVTFGIMEDDISIFRKVIIWKILRWLLHLLQDKKWPNYRDIAGRYLIPHNYHLALHFWWFKLNETLDTRLVWGLPHPFSSCLGLLVIVPLQRNRLLPLLHYCVEIGSGFGQTYPNFCYLIVDLLAGLEWGPGQRADVFRVQIIVLS